MNRRLLRRELRREALEFVRENPTWTREQLDEHLTEEFAGLPGIDPATLIEMILAILTLLQSLFNRDT